MLDMSKNITTNFRKSEFDSKDGSEMPEAAFVNVIILSNQLQVLRDYVKSSITINSGYRSKDHNSAIGGSKNSQHLYGKASDITVNGMSPKEVYNVIEKLIEDGKMLEGGLGLYNTFVHYDHRGTKARWDYSD